MGDYQKIFSLWQVTLERLRIIQHNYNYSRSTEYRYGYVISPLSQKNGIYDYTSFILTQIFVQIEVVRFIRIKCAVDNRSKNLDTCSLALSNFIFNVTVI